MIFFFEVPANTKYSYRTAGMDWFLIPGCIPTSRPPFLGRTLDTVRLWPGWISYWRPMNDLCRGATDRNLNRFQHDLWVVLWALFIVIYIIDVWLFKCKWNSFLWWIKCCAQSYMHFDQINVWFYRHAKHLMNRFWWITSSVSILNINTPLVCWDDF